jgi:hypothetical protein
MLAEGQVRIDVRRGVSLDRAFISRRRNKGTDVGLALYLEGVLVGDLPKELQVEGRSHGFDRRHIVRWVCGWLLATLDSIGGCGVGTEET